MHALLMEDTQDGGWSIWAITDYRWHAPFINKSWIMHMENTWKIVQLYNDPILKFPKSVNW